MMAAESAVFSPSDSQGINANVPGGTTTTIGRVPRFQLPNFGAHGKLLIGALIALAILYLLDRSKRGRR